jgi:hypothetical protein
MAYLGIDISKAKLHVCLLEAESGKGKTKVVRAGPGSLDRNFPGLSGFLRVKPPG